MLQDYKITVEIPVQWRDMDAAQHVNNVVYLKWIEAARIRYFMHLNGGKLQNNENIGPILAWQECKYINPIVFPDSVIVGIKRVDTLGDKIITESKIFSKSQNKLAAISRQHTVSYDFKRRCKVPLPLDWLYNS